MKKFILSAAFIMVASALFAQTQNTATLDQDCDGCEAPTVVPKAKVVNLLYSRIGINRVMINTSDAVSTGDNNIINVNQLGAGNYSWVRQDNSMNGLGAVGNLADVDQVGNQNNSEITQTHVSHEAFVNQRGSWNSSNIEQSHDDNYANVDQGRYGSGTGDNNYAVIDQWGGAGNRAEIGSWGDNNDAFQVQLGSRNLANIFQFGSDNYSEQTQTGDDNTASVNFWQSNSDDNISVQTQTGNDNWAWMDVRGDRNTLVQIQDGNDNDAVSRHSLSQDGDDNFGDQYQKGDDNFAEISQRGDRNTSFQSSVGDRNSSGSDSHGDDNYNEVTQIGDDNYAFAGQWASSNGSDRNTNVITQTGDSNSASSIQYEDDNFSVQTQTGDFSYSNSSQRGNMNTGVSTQTSLVGGSMWSNEAINNQNGDENFSYVSQAQNQAGLSNYSNVFQFGNYNAGAVNQTADLNSNTSTLTQTGNMNSACIIQHGSSVVVSQ